MKKTRILTSILLLTVMMILAGSTSVFAAGISKKSVTLTVGKSTTLSVKGTNKKVSWKSSKKSVATVSGKGKVKAVKAGTAKITAKVSKKTYSCTVTVLEKSQSGAAAEKIETKSASLNNGTAGMSAEEARVYRSIMAKKTQYYEGRFWDNSIGYRWNGGIFRTGYGCSGLAFLLSDAAFGTTLATRHNNFDDIRVGDIVRLNYNRHSVIVLQNLGDSIIVAEGNFNSSVHWGRQISLEEVKRTGTYVMTRYE